MTGAFEWIGQIAEWCGQFFPRWQVIDTRHGAIKWVALRVRDVVRGRRAPMAVVVYPRGSFAIWWPLVSEFEVYPTAYQTTPLTAQDIVTTDGKVITARGILAYEIEDLEKIQAHTWDPEDTIRDIAATSFHDVLVRLSWEELKAAQGRKLDTLLKNEVKKDLADRGVKVHKFTLSSLAPCRVLRVVQSTSKEGEIR